MDISRKFFFKKLLFFSLVVSMSANAGVVGETCNQIFHTMAQPLVAAQKTTAGSFAKVKNFLTINPYRSLSLEDVQKEFASKDRLKMRDILGSTLPEAPKDLPISQSLALPESYRVKLRKQLLDHLILTDRLNQIPESRAFVNWIEKNETLLFSRERMQLILDRDYTLGDTLREIHTVYVLQKSGGGAKFLEATFRNTVKNPMLQKIAAPFLKTTDKLVASIRAMLVGALIAGPIAGGLNNYLAGPVGPIHSYANQRGQQDLSAVTRFIQATLSEMDGTRQAAEQTAQRMEALLGEMNRYDFKGLSPQEAHDLWKVVERRFRTNTLEMAKATPGDVREGRGMERDFHINIPRSFIQDITSMNSNYEIHAMRMEQAQKQLLEPGADKEKIEKQIAYHKNFMDQASRNIATILAAWTIYDFVYFEFTRDYKVGETQRNMAYQTIKQSFHMDLYLESVKNMANEMLAGMGYPIQVENFAKGFRSFAESLEEKKK
jgi:hypothetical protein